MKKTVYFLFCLALVAWGAADVFAFSQSDLNKVYRFYSQNNRAHFYTNSEAEKNLVGTTYPIEEWKCEGVAWQAFNNQNEGRLPVYRFWSDLHRAHFYTISEQEKKHVEKTYQPAEWRYEGVAYYAFPQAFAGTQPIHRFYSKVNQKHFYTISEAEKDLIIQGAYPESGWEYEGVAWYTVPPVGSLSCNLPTGNLGREITVGLLSFTKNELRDNSFRLEANKNYRIKDKDGKVLAQNVNADAETRVKYDSGGKLKIYESVAEQLVSREVQFEAADGNNSDLIFEIKRPSMTYKQYRGKMKLRYSEHSKKIWVIETLPLEQYLWGFGEITGTGDDDYDRTMLTAARTYAYWKILYSTKYASEGFKVVPTPANQIYRGYDYEKKYGDIRKAAEATRGKIIKHKDGDVALSPYSSWTDGRTRSFEERWGSKDYPWCQSVKDSYGKHPSMSTQELFNSGNHMVGISAHGALSLAGDHGWDWQRIIKYYLDDVSVVSIY